MTPRPAILPLLQACVTRSGHVDADALAAARDAWQADRAALETAEAAITHALHETRNALVPLSMREDAPAGIARALVELDRLQSELATLRTTTGEGATHEGLRP